MKDSFILEGKKYISSRRASEISDYSSDYIGQLCRAEKLDCKMVGRAWFVTEESLHLHKANVLHDEIHRNRIQNLRGKKSDKSEKSNSDSEQSRTTEQVRLNWESPIKADQVVAKQSVVTGVVTPKNQEISQDTESVFSSETLKYIGDERALLPELNKKESKNIFDNSSDISETKYSVPIESVNIFGSVANIEAYPEKTSKYDFIKNSRIGSKRITSPYVADLRTAEIRTVDNDAQLPVLQNLATHDRVEISEVNHTPYIQKTLIACFLVVLVAGGWLFFSAGKNDSNSTGTQVASINSVLVSIGDAIEGGVGRILSVFKHEDVQVAVSSDLNTSIDNSIGKSKETVSHSVPDWNGIAIAPSGSELGDDQIIKERIQASFSDQVEVTPDGSGTAGVIRPVFKSSTGNNFVYVLVPVDQKRTP